MKATEFAFICSQCEKSESWTTEIAAQAAAVWHVYDDHWDIWMQLTGSPERLPVDKRPEDYGRKFEEWERQS